ncbi:MAG: hypothetical protein ACXWJM_02625 [Ramlibacter sp.]
MKPSKDKARKPVRPEFGAPPRAKSLGHPPRSERGQRRPADFSDMTGIAAHGEDVAADREKPLPREDRAG